MKQALWRASEGVSLQTGTWEEVTFFLMTPFLGVCSCSAAEHEGRSEIVFVFSGRARPEHTSKNGVIKNFHTSQAAFLKHKHASSTSPE